MEHIYDSTASKTSLNHGPSDRNWGLTLGTISLGLAYWWRLHLKLALPFASLGLILILTAFIMPRLLKKLNHNWQRLGDVLAKITNPIVIGAIFFLIVTPLGLIRRMLAHATVRTKIDASVHSYWIERTPAPTDPQSLKRPF